MMVKSFVFPLRVYVEDTDFGGMVYHANYLKYMERARTEWLASVSMDIDRMASLGLFFVVRDAHISYHQPAKLNNQLEIVSSISKIGRSSIVFQHRVVGKEKTERSLCEATVQLVCVNSDVKPVSVPEELREVFV